MEQGQFVESPVVHGRLRGEELEAAGMISEGDGPESLVHRQPHIVAVVNLVQITEAEAEFTDERGACGGRGTCQCFGENTIWRLRRSGSVGSVAHQRRFPAQW